MTSMCHRTCGHLQKQLKFQCCCGGLLFCYKSVLWASPADSSLSMMNTSSMVILSAILASVVSEIGLGSGPAFSIPGCNSHCPWAKGDHTVRSWTVVPISLDNKNSSFVCRQHEDLIQHQELYVQPDIDKDLLYWMRMVMPGIMMSTCLACTNKNVV
ncbi:unnamed protein product [Cuscuta europaea]|uniref:Uncharacterized protein n=1 Tax=Cuscuta europaea TaxID=41803 RepID=A0A9P1E251_CUSEU|nr:unnamed protein product [Cuscuta europaea]